MSHYVPRLVVCAANRWNDVIVLGARHFDGLMHAQIKRLPSLPPSPADWEQGFVDQHGVFMDRREALAVATAAGQIGHYRPKTNPEHILFSEDLY